MNELSTQLLQVAARLVVDEGIEPRAAKERALKELGLRSSKSLPLPSNEELEDEVRAHIALFHADTQDAELLALRELALGWMQRLARFRPHLTGPVWRGTATRLSPIHLQLYCDDPKALELFLIDERLDFDAGSHTTRRSHEQPLLRLSPWCAALGEPATLLLWVFDFDDLRGAFQPDARGASLRGDLAALRALLNPPTPPLP